MNFRFTIARKLLIGFGIIFIFVVANAILTYTTLTKSNELIQKINETYQPTIRSMKDLRFILNRSKTLTLHWVTEDKEDTQEKEDLKKIHSTLYPKIKEDIHKLSKKLDHSDKKKIDSLVSNIDSIFLEQHDIMLEYDEEENYWTPQELYEKRYKYKKSYEQGERHSQISEIQKSLTDINKSLTDLSDKLSTEMTESFDTLTTYVVWMSIALIVGIFLIAFFTSTSIVKPVNMLREILIIMGKGVMPKERIGIRNDEIGDMTSALYTLVDAMKDTSNFAKEIGSANFNSEYHPMSKEDILGNSLLIMRDNLAKVSEEDRKRNWTTEGLAKFGEILRKNSDNVRTLTEGVISELIIYLDANQGGIFIKNDESKQKFMELSGCYAWDRIKYLEQHIHKGEGLVGQAWQEKSTLFITDVPEDYINISSGLGQANPKCLLIVPMIINDEVFGVIEVASFHYYEEYKIAFVERLAESIASAISTVKVNQRTKNLLEQAQKASAQMRNQEEELRNNQEEMKMNQKLMEKSLEEHAQRIKNLKHTNEKLREESSILQNLLLKASKDVEKFKEKIGDIGTSPSSTDD